VSAIDEKLSALGIHLVDPPRPVARYRTCVKVGDMAFLSGHGPILEDGTAITGCVGRELDLEQGQKAARQTAINMLSTLKAELGSLDRIKRVVKILGLVQCTDDFHDQPGVMDGCSELFYALMGEQGIGVRSAIGCNSLPGNIAVEIEGIFQIS